MPRSGFPMWFSQIFVRMQRLNRSYLSLNFKKVKEIVFVLGVNQGGFASRDSFAGGMAWLIADDTGAS